MTYALGSLCTGAAMLDMAVRAVYGPARQVFHAETDPDASMVLAAHHPDVPNLGDITGGAPAGCPDGVMRAAAYAKWSAVPPVDVLAAGWPCQVASVMGRRLGSADDRYLWPAVAGTVAALRPAVFLGENVPGLLTIEGGAMFGRVLADLDDLGYTVRWSTVGACRVGACHHRHRVFLAATRGADRPVGEPAGCRSGGRWAAPADLFGAYAPLRHWPAAGVISGGNMWPRRVQVCGDDGMVLLPTPMARDGEGRGEGSADYWNGCRPDGTPRRSKGMPLGAAIGLLPTDGWGRYADAVARGEILAGRRAPRPTVPGIRGGDGLAGPFVEWMLGLAEGHVSAHVDNGAAVRILGNGVMWQAAALAAGSMLPALPAAAT